MTDSTAKATMGQNHIELEINTFINRGKKKQLLNAEYSFSV